MGDTEKILFFIGMMLGYIGSLSGTSVIYLFVLRHKGHLQNNQVGIEVESQTSSASSERTNEELELRLRNLERLKVRIKCETMFLTLIFW